MNTLQIAHRSPKTKFEEEVVALNPWFHNLHLPEGQTAPDHPLGDFPRFKWEGIAPHIPESLESWTALDIGCNAGFYSFELAKRGAAVRGIDLDEHYLKQAAWAAGKLGVNATFEKRTVYEVAREEERYDLVWFMGVFYHLRYPLLVLDLLARKAKRLFVFQSLTAPESAPARVPPDNLAYESRSEMRAADWPSMSFIERRFAGDPTNWWAATPGALEAMLRTAGLRVIARPDAETFICEPAPRSEWREEQDLAAKELDAVKAAFGL